MQEVRGSSPRVTTRLLQKGAAPATAAGAALRKRALGRRDYMLRPFGAEVRRGRRDGGGPQEGGPEAGEDRREQHERARRGDDHGERDQGAELDVEGEARETECDVARGDGGRHEIGRASGREGGR